MASFLKKVQQQKLGAKLKGSITATKESLSKAKTKADVLIAAAAVDLHANVESTLERFEVDYNKYLSKPVILSGNVWKRRGGMGKFRHMTSATDSGWELRRMELRGTTLLYYNASHDEEEIVLDSTATPTKTTLSASTVWSRGTNNGGESSASLEMTTDADKNSTPALPLPRGHLDLAEEKATVHACLGHVAGAPSPFCLNIVTMGTVKPETKWRLAFEDHASLMQWLAAMTNVIVQVSVDGYNVQLLKAANPNNPDPPPVFLRRPTVCEPPSQSSGLQLHQEEGGGSGTGGAGNGTSTSTTTANEVASPTKIMGASHHQLWFTGEYTISNHAPHDTTTTAAGDAQQQQQQQEQQQHEPLSSMLATNHTTRTLYEMEQQHRQELQKWELLHRQELQQAQEQIQQLLLSSKNNNDNDNTDNNIKQELELIQNKNLELQEQVTALQEQIISLQATFRQQVQDMQDKHQQELAVAADKAAQDKAATNEKSNNTKQEELLKAKEDEIAKLTLELQQVKAAHVSKIKQLEESLSMSEQGKVLAIKLVEDQWQKKMEKEKHQAQKRLDAMVQEQQQLACTSATQVQHDKDKDVAAAKDVAIAELQNELETMKISSAQQIQSLQDELVTAQEKYNTQVAAVEQESQQAIQQLTDELQQQAKKMTLLQEQHAATSNSSGNQDDPNATTIDESQSDFDECEEFEDAVG